MFSIVNGTILTLLAITCLVPFIYIIAVSFSGESAIIRNEVRLIPVDFHLNAYKAVFMNSQVIRSFFNTVYVTVMGTVINIVLTILTAFALSRRDLKGSKVIMSMIVFTMLFNGGMEVR